MTDLAMISRAPVGRSHNDSGHTLLELITVMALLGILAASAAPFTDSRRQDINTAVNVFIANVRQARARAITSGSRVQFNWLGSGKYEIRPLEEDNAAQWIATAKPSRQGAVPDTVQVAMQTTSFEFDTWGMMVSSEDPIDVDFSDAFGARHRVSVWPSGQVYYEY
jgi:prepilin-type N-terminal cleavage/methylation domain-containing protein